MSRGNVSGRLERLEASAHGGPSGRCPECSGTASYVVVYGTETPSRKAWACPACGRPLDVWRLVYDGEAERPAP